MKALLEAWKGKRASFGLLGPPKKSPKFQFSVSGNINVSLFGVMTKTLVLSDKNVPLKKRQIWMLAEFLLANKKDKWAAVL